MRFSPIVGLIAGTTLIRLAFAATTGLGVDESYMVTAGRVLSLGYFDHPPASWWLAWGASHLFNTEAPWAVRLPFVLLFAVSQCLLFRITCLVADRPAGFWAVVALNLSPVFGVTTGSWVLPDGPLDTALLGAALCLLRAMPETGRRGLFWWVTTGLCAGLALFSKYSAALTIGGAFLYLLATPRHRHWLARPEPYIAAVLALAIFSPVPIWNAAHGWASFAFQGNRAAGLRFRPLMPIQTLGGEALFVLPWIWLPMMILFVRGFRCEADQSRRLLVWLAAPPIVVFALVSAWSSQRILYHWAAPGYLMLFPLLGQAIAHRVRRPWVSRAVVISASLVLASMTAIATQLQFDWLGSRLARVMSADPTAEGLDWTSIREDLRARGLLPPGAIVATLNWRDAGKIGYALGRDTTILCLNSDARQFGFAHPPHEYAGKNVLVLAVGPADEARHWFLSVDNLPVTSVRLDGRTLLTVTVLQGDGLLPRP
jgi:4-amino-4-deoxy-L-arabinose transferase-like glycosyltransferase